MSSKKAPSLKVVLYGINRITYPKMLWENTPELLDLFSLSELYRQRIVSNCLEVLQWNGFYTKEDASDTIDGVPLSREDISLLGRILRKAQNKVLRETYRSIVLQICASVSLVQCFSVRFQSVENIKTSTSITCVNPIKPC